ncbi:hypothetical protein EKN06_13975 [Croceicoccus ponticola]|uniref:Acyl-CoA dehydrogenase/oxidase N-terminal domain-containing protein n=1 Tax=Croceicoccus ponticola TaxID=2217664 RepID=A0A437GUY0_9SPHN|nr:acyl-CoA dehydrogenase family protein [Croceicoccus ponticola]RVQ65122.1 hypothetical protein EKN06_13975 [Croceicoccus ponticola]
MILDGTQVAIQDAVRAFAQDRIRPNSAASEGAGGYRCGLFEELAELGLMGMTAPSQFGGAEADFVSYALALIEIAAADGALSTIISIQNSFIVPTDSKGYSVDKVEHKLGQGASDTYAIRFEDLFVPDDLRLGAEGAGYGLALSNLEVGLVGIAAQAIGIAKIYRDVLACQIYEGTSDI